MFVCYVLFKLASKRWKCQNSLNNQQKLYIFKQHTYIQTQSTKGITFISFKMRSADYVVPARFIVTLGHVLAIVMAMYTISDNVETTIGVTESLTNVNLVASTTAGANLILYISLGTALFDICGLVSGYSMFQGGINVAHIMLHFLGSVYTSWFIMYQWNITTLWYIFVPFGLLPFLIELSVFIRIGCCNADLY